MRIGGCCGGACCGSKASIATILAAGFAVPATYGVFQLIVAENAHTRLVWGIALGAVGLLAVGTGLVLARKARRAKGPAEREVVHPNLDAGAGEKDRRVGRE